MEGLDRYFGNKGKSKKLGCCHYRCCDRCHVCHFRGCDGCDVWHFRCCDGCEVCHFRRREDVMFVIFAGAIV